jgi:hypothetical protein
LPLTNAIKALVDHQEVAATKDVVEMEIGSSTAEKVANMASQPGSSGTVGSKKRKWGFGVDPTGGVLTKGTHSLVSTCPLL